MIKFRIALIACVFYFFSGYAQKGDTIQSINDNKALTDSLAGYSNLTPVLKNSEEIPNFNRKEITVYKFNLPVDIPILAVGTGWSLYAFTKIYRKGNSTEEQILNLKISNINSFDRWAVRPYSKSIDDFSYYPFYAAIPLPFVFFLTGADMRNDFGKLSLLYWETMAVTGIFGTSAPYFVDRYRPYAYSVETPMEKRRHENAKNSFYAGHVEIISVSAFFMAKIYWDYYPESNVKWVFFGAAAGATGAMVYMRHQAGMHFPSDNIIGSAMGALCGILVPQFHKQKLVKGHEMGIVPFMNQDIRGFTFIYK